LRAGSGPRLRGGRLCGFQFAQAFAALKAGFAKAVELGGPKKAIICTESRRTQDYLVRLLSANGYDGQLALFTSRLHRRH
jgi:hypothetical protein